MTLVITGRVALSPEAERLAARLIDVLADVRNVLGDIRNMLSREGWNALARQEQDTGPGLPSKDARPAEGALGAPSSAGEASDPPAAHPAADASPRAAAPADPPDAAAPGRPNAKWSAERDAELRRCYRAGWSRARMLAAVNALPGAPIASIYGIGCRLSQLGISAGASSGPHGPRSAAPQARVMAPVEPPPPAGRLRQEEASVLRSTARPAVVYDGFMLASGRALARGPQMDALAALPASRRAGSELVERDGAPSVTRTLIAQDDADSACAPIALADAIEWGRRNGCKPEPGETALATFRRVNALRQRFGLPRYTLIAARGPQEKLPPADAERRL